MDIIEAKRMMRHAGSYTGQNESATLVLSELERIEKEQDLLKSSLANARITIVVSGGMVQNIYTNLEINVGVDVLDFDDNGTRSKNEHEEMESYLQCIISEQHEIY